MLIWMFWCGGLHFYNKKMMMMMMKDTLFGLIMTDALYLRARVLYFVASARCAWLNYTIYIMCVCVCVGKLFVYKKKTNIRAHAIKRFKYYCIERYCHHHTFIIAIRCVTLMVACFTKNKFPSETWRSRRKVFKCFPPIRNGLLVIY